MRILVIEEDVCAEGLEQFILAQPTEEIGLIDIYAPLAQGLYNAEVRREAARSDNSQTQGRELDGCGQTLLYL